MQKLRAAVIGCGAPQKTGKEGWKIGYAHAAAYSEIKNTELVAAADINAENLAEFSDHFGVSAAYLDYRKMLANEEIDLVSVCTWVGLHAEIVIAAAESGVRGILCEKPMALSMAETNRMLDVCKANNVQFALNTQRRLGEPWITAKQLVESGEIGAPLRFEGSCPDWDLMEWGSHWVDMCRFFASDTPVKWVLAQVDASEERRIFGHLVENDAVISIGFEDNFTGILYTGDHAPRDFSNRVLGSSGIIEIHDNEIKYLGTRNPGWLVPDVSQGSNAMVASIEALITAIRTGIEAPHGATSARSVSEIIMAAYQSAAENRVIEMPLDAMDFPLERLVLRYRAGLS